MAVILYKNADRTVNTIAERNNIPYKIDHMVVVVLDSIADINAGAGIATYRWNESQQIWILVSKTGANSLNFKTEELTIADGKVLPSHIPVGNQIWNITVIDGDVIKADIRIEDLTVSASEISGLSEYNGYELRFTYAYGTVSQQIQAYIDQKASEIAAQLDGNSGTINDFNGALV